MTANFNPGTAEVPSQRVAVIGNSYIGALALAYRHYTNDPWLHYFSFFGRTGDCFGELTVKDRALVGVGISSERASNLIDHYDYFVIFADLPAPHRLAEIEGWLKNEGFSHAVREAQRSDMVRGCAAFSLSRQLLALTSAPVMLLCNICLDDIHLTEEQYDWSVRALRELVEPAILIEPPRAMLDDNFITHSYYHKDSVGLDGTRPQGRPNHDRAHLNSEGGRLLLGHVAHMVRRHCAAQTMVSVGHYR